MKYRILFKASARKELNNLPDRHIEAIDKKILLLMNNPRSIGYKKLSGILNLYRVRVMDYRIIYSIHDKILIIEVIKIAHRKDVYKKSL
ncbi:MAG: type II toxin-antitoxin system RelE/ParE family toxin [Bacteroidota bacterium]